MKTIVISAVNLNTGGTLTILRDCLGYLSASATQKDYRIIAIVFEKDLADFPNIEYIETQWPKKRWINRLWYEYVSMNRISMEIGAVHLWFSLHDTTPNVVAKRRAVYCHNPFPFYKWRLKECILAPKIVLFALFSKLIYRKNIKQNDKIVVQQQWLKEEFKQLFSLPKDKIVVASPDFPKDEQFPDCDSKPRNGNQCVFIYPASPNTHKNFECLCRAVAILETEGMVNFKVKITVSGNENRYAEWLYKRWGQSGNSLQWIGFQNREMLFDHYEEADCLVFPSKIETWGLPISEFSTLNRPMLLADLPYAHETAAGSKQVAFFDPACPEVLARQMRLLVEGDTSFLAPVPKQQTEEPLAKSWEALFNILLEPSK